MKTKKAATTTEVTDELPATTGTAEVTTEPTGEVETQTEETDPWAKYRNVTLSDEIKTPGDILTITLGAVSRLKPDQRDIFTERTRKVNPSFVLSPEGVVEEFNNRLEALGKPNLPMYVLLMPRDMLKGAISIIADGTGNRKLKQMVNSPVVQDQPPWFRATGDVLIGEQSARRKQSNARNDITSLAELFG